MRGNRKLKQKLCKKRRWWISIFFRLTYLPVVAFLYTFRPATAPWLDESSCPSCRRSSGGRSVWCQQTAGPAEGERPTAGAAEEQRGAQRHPAQWTGPASLNHGPNQLPPGGTRPQPGQIRASDGHTNTRRRRWLSKDCCRTASRDEFR